MSYKVERYKDFQRFNGQYEQICHFLLEAADNGYNEHFHWGRFEWMMRHTLLDIKELDKIALFRDKNNALAGVVTYDTCFDDNVYLVHSMDDTELLKSMMDFAVQNYQINGKTVIKSNQNDIILNSMLAENGFVKKRKDSTVLVMSLEQSLDYDVPEGFEVSPPDFVTDSRSYQNVIHKGFDHEGEPKPWDKEFSDPTPNSNNALKVFALNEQTEYCAHCGVWYTMGETAYIEPVVTIPQFRRMGLGKAVVYEAVRRAKKLGTKRAVVLSDQEFYFRIGFQISSEVFCWERSCMRK